MQEEAASGVLLRGVLSLLGGACISAHAQERGGPKAHRGAGWWAGCREALGGWSQGRVRADGEDERRGEGREQRRPIVKMER